MNTARINLLISDPLALEPKDMDGLSKLVNEYPFFQAIRSLELKLLKNKNSFKYNYKLKQLAAFTTDREVLFDFITAKEFNQLQIAKSIQTEVLAKDDISLGLTEEAADQINNPDLFQPKTIGSEEKSDPFDFSTQEKHSFQEWLKITTMQPVRKNQTETRENELEENQKNFDLIDQFLEKNPKIKPSKTYAPNKSIKPKTQPSSQLMTETLAKVYTEQKRYDKAIQAYKILILNNPEKSSFFADQIEKLNQIIENNK
ncbi:MAG: hypothetical protein ACQESK_09820 [Bacteroidota bacterium]